MNKLAVILALLFVFLLSVLALDYIPKHKVLDNETIKRIAKMIENEKKKLSNNKLHNNYENNLDNFSTFMNNCSRNKRNTLYIPEKKTSTQQTTNFSLIENTNNTYTISFSIKKSLEEGKKNIKYSSDPNIILLLGLSGVGKSTLSQYLFGNNSNLISVAVKDEYNETTGGFYIKDTEKKIGHDALLSYTELPDLVIDPETNKTIYDCPGFSDTRDPVHDISGAYFIKAVTDNAKALKFIFVVNYDSVITGGSKEEFIKLARHATNMINNISKYNESIALVATKIKDNITDNQRIRAIAVFLQNIRRTLHKINEEPNIQLFIDILLTTSGADNRNYTRIGVMPKFDKEGPLIDIPLVQAHKKSLLTIIHNNTKFTKIDRTDIKPTISSNSTYYIDGLVKEVSDQIWIYIKDVVQKVQVFYDDLIQNMRNEIHSFNNEKAAFNQLKAELFLTKLNRGFSVISKFVKNIESKTITLNQLLEYITKSTIISEVSLSQEIVSNISTQHKYLKFLLTVHKSKDSFNNVDGLITLFKNLENQLTISRNYFYNNISDVTDQIKKTILSIDNNIMNKIQKNYTRLTETIEDNKKLFSLINSGYFKLMEIRDIPINASQLTITYKCIDQIEKTVQNFNFIETADIKFVNDTLRNTLKLTNQINFLQNLTNQSTIIRSLQCTNEINRVIYYLDDLRKWYSLLIRLFEKLSWYSVQKDIATCIDLVESIMSHKAPARAADIMPGLFVETCFSVDEYKAAGINNVILDKFKLDALKRVINHTLHSNLIYSCGLNSPDHLVVKGHYIKLSDLNKSPCIENATFVEIFALNKIFIDISLDKTGINNFSLSIISPIWEIHGHHKIKLDGKPGNAHTQQKAPSGRNVSIPHGKDGAPGLPGGPGGNFLGIGANFIDSNDLSISADGGSGGPGQDGGDGMNGQDDIECPSSFKDEDYPHKKDCKSFDWLLSSYFFVVDCSHQSRFDGFSIDIRTHDIYSQIVTFYPKNNWPFKGNGTNAGNGGQGGVKGYAGNITVIAKDNQSINIRNQIGKTGSNGQSGMRGEAGKKGRNLVVSTLITKEVSGFDDITVAYMDSESHEFVTSKESYFPGNAGTNGYNAQGIKAPKKSLSLLEFGHNSTTAYKTFAYKYLSDHKEDLDLKNFLDFLEKN